MGPKATSHERETKAILKPQASSLAGGNSLLQSPGIPRPAEPGKIPYNPGDGKWQLLPVELLSLLTFPWGTLRMCPIP